jgi:hypothetical protein
MSAGALRLVVFSALLTAALGRLTGECLAQENGDAAPAADHHGALDSGAGVLQLVDAESGQPLRIDNLAFGPGPALWAGGALDLPGVEARVHMLAVPTDHHGDKRVRTLLHVELLNYGQEQVQVKLGARLSAGGSDPLRRPVDALDFVPGTLFAQEDGVITRDGRAILAWQGPDPQVKVLGAPAGPDDPVCLLSWDLPVQPNTARFLDLCLAGPAHQPELDEAGWRQTLENFSYNNAEEQLTWQTNSRGTYILFDCAVPQLNRALDAGIHFLRSLGDANHEVVWLTDRPYGFPPTDAAVPAEIVGVFTEWGIGAFADDYLRQAVADATAAGQQLSPERRTALVAGLVAAVRLVHSDEQLARDLAGVIQSLVVAEAPVEPWLDPDVVRADMAAILLRADPVGGAEAAAKLPKLRWAERTDGPVAAHMLAARRALSGGDRDGFWEHYSALLEGTNRNGLGSMQPGGELDGQFPIGFMTLSRAMLIDDHGRDLRLLPGMNVEMLPDRNQFLMPFMPSVFGQTNIETFRVAGNRVSTTLGLRAVIDPHLIYVNLPAPLVASRVVDSVGGKARMMPDGSFSAAIAPYQGGGLNFTVVLAKEPPAEH